MGSRNSFHGINGQAVRVIRFKAGQLASLPCFTRSDVEDLEQEMVLDMLRRLPGYDPTRAGLATFLTSVIEHCAATLVTKAMVGNGERVTLSLDDLDPNDDDKMVDSAANTNRLDMVMDVHRLVKKMPEEHRRICKWLMVVDKQSVPQRMGISRATFYRRLDEIRGLFRKAGMKRILAIA